MADSTLISNAPVAMDYQTELDETQRALREVTLMIEQSQAEVNKLTQRNAAITGHLQQVQKQIGALRANIVRGDQRIGRQVGIHPLRDGHHLAFNICDIQPVGPGAQPPKREGQCDDGRRPPHPHHT